MKFALVDTLYSVALFNPRDQWESEDRFSAIESALAILPRAMMWPEGTHGNQDDHYL